MGNLFGSVAFVGATVVIKTDHVTLEAHTESRHIFMCVASAGTVFQQKVREKQEGNKYGEKY